MPNDGDADQWCAIGAVARVCRDDTIDEHPPAPFEPGYFLNLAAHQLHTSVHTGGMVSFVWVNDRLGHAAVLSMYDRAIQLAEAHQ